MNTNANLQLKYTMNTTETIITVCHQTFARPNSMFVRQGTYGLTDCQIREKD